MLLPATAGAQQLAFPGAEGAGRFAAGGRGGDVYYVTNLNDSGAGSLRTGISSATGPRTILFNVAGTIHLQSNLDINKSNITIAGQSAPGGGITIADRQTRVVNPSTVQTHDVVLQHLRFRVGDIVSSANPGTYEPDALWIAGSNNVMIDHVSASWGVDEVLSVSHASTNVTVQWSMVTEALRNAGHSKGAHGYGSIIDGGAITYHHNLWADNDSRNPRPGGTTLQGDLVNNVISNPGFRYGYDAEADTLQLNMIGNYGVSGPSTSTGSLFASGGTGTQIYQQGNFIDSNKDGVLNGVTASGTAMVSGAFTSSPTPFGTGTVAATDARKAYIQVLSRAGASYYRDSTDRRVIRNAMNQTGGIIDSQNQVGGWATLPTGAAPADSNSDGVPDYYANSKGFAANVAIGKQVGPNGYTWLENYLQTLTPNAYAPGQNLTTPLRSVADAVVAENLTSGQTATASGDGTSTTLSTRWNGGAGGSANRNEYVLLRFDLTSIRSGSISDARLEMTPSSALTGTAHKVKVYGVEHDLAGNDWVESSVTFANSPALTFDGNSVTRGLDSAKVLTLGTFDASNAAANSTVMFDNANLAVFLNLAAYYQAAGNDRFVSLLLERIDSGNGLTSFYSREAGTSVAPRLIVTAEAVPEPTLLGPAVLLGLLAVRRRRRSDDMDRSIRY